MDFIKKLFAFTGATGTVGKVLTVVGGLLFLFVFFWLLTSAWGLWNNDISQAAHVAGAGVKIVGWILFGAAIFWAWWNWSDSIPFRINETAATVILFVLFVLALLFWTGWYEGVY